MFKCRSDLSAARSESNYSIYSINGGFEGRPRGISELGCLVSTPWTHKSFIDKCRLTSQAGRRGFEPHLPLQLFNNLHTPPNQLLSHLSQSDADGSDLKALKSDQSAVTASCFRAIEESTYRPR